MTGKHKSNRGVLTAEQRKEKWLEGMGFFAGLGDHVKDAAACRAELHAKVRRLRGNFFHRIGDAEWLSVPAVGDVVIIGSVEQVIIPSRALPVHRKPDDEADGAKDGAPGCRHHARQSRCQRNGL